MGIIPSHHETILEIYKLYATKWNDLPRQVRRNWLNVWRNGLLNEKLKPDDREMLARILDTMEQEEADFDREERNANAEKEYWEIRMAQEMLDEQ